MAKVLLHYGDHIEETEFKILTYSFDFERPLRLPFVKGIVERTNFVFRGRADGLPIYYPSGKTRMMQNARKSAVLR